MRFEELVSRLSVALAGPLPGVLGQALMAPRPRREWPPGFNIARIRHAAALLLLAPHQDSAAVILTVRADALGHHGGQVSMPGGVIEPDELAAAAAIREAHEEIGLRPESVRILGSLTPIDIPISGFRLHPIVATVADTPVFHPAPDEVARVLQVPLPELLDASRIVWRSTPRDGRLFEFPAFPFDGAEIWGATAMVLAEFLALLDWPGPAEP